MSPSTVAPPSPAEALAERLDDPQVAESLNTLLDHADLLAVLLAGLDGFIRHGETIMDSTVASLADARLTMQDVPGLAGVDLRALAAAAAALGSVLPKAAPVVTSLSDHGTLDDLAAPEHAHVLGLLARGVAQGHRDFARDPVPVHGPRSIVRLLRDEDLRRSVSFLATIGRALGRTIATAKETR